MTKPIITNRIRVAKSFFLDEFVPPEIYNLYGASSTWFVRPELIKLAQYLRDYFGKRMTINNWATGGSFSERGFRTPDSVVGQKLGQHKFGTAIDFNFEGITPNEVRSSIQANAVKFLGQGLTTLEDEAYASTWVHADIRATNMDKILIVRPATAAILDSEFNPAQTEYFIYDGKELFQIEFRLIEQEL